MKGIDEFQNLYRPIKTPVILRKRGRNVDRRVKGLDIFLTPIQSNKAQWEPIKAGLYIINEIRKLVS